jgi:hypothetical protein
VKNYIDAGHSTSKYMTEQITSLGHVVFIVKIVLSLPLFYRWWIRLRLIIDIVYVSTNSNAKSIRSWLACSM